jgi:hypothetical protein
MLLRHMLMEQGLEILRKYFFSMTQTINEKDSKFKLYDCQVSTFDAPLNNCKKYLGIRAIKNCSLGFIIIHN